jgi:hypothetical protein
VVRAGQRSGSSSPARAGAASAASSRQEAATRDIGFERKRAAALGDLPRPR